ncbi:MAG: hypothetical protein V1861_00225 [Candidatus Micrarchaeota archaeon]
MKLRKTEKIPIKEQNSFSKIRSTLTEGLAIAGILFSACASIPRSVRDNETRTGRIASGEAQNSEASDDGRQGHRQETLGHEVEESSIWSSWNPDTRKLRAMVLVFEQSEQPEIIRRQAMAQIVGSCLHELDISTCFERTIRASIIPPEHDNFVRWMKANMQTLQGARMSFEFGLAGLLPNMPEGFFPFPGCEEVIADREVTVNMPASTGVVAMRLIYGECDMSVLMGSGALVRVNFTPDQNQNAMPASRYLDPRILNLFTRP